MFETERLRLRRFTESDLEHLHQMVSDPEVMRHYPKVLDWEGARKWLDAILAAYDRFGYSLFAVERRHDGIFVGHLGVDRIVSFIAVANGRSIAVAERNGMKRLKRLDENRFGVPIYVYGIYRSEWTGT